MVLNSSLKHCIILSSSRLQSVLPSVNAIVGARVTSRSLQGCSLRYRPSDAAHSQILRQSQSADSSETIRETKQRHVLLEGEVHVHWIDPDEVSQNLLDTYRQMLSVEELYLVNAGATEEMKRERLISRVLLRTTLAKYCPDSVGATDLQFSQGPYGKPEISAPLEAIQGGLYFNISHTAGLQGCAVSRGALVGLDIEDITRNTTDPMRIARRYFAPAEVHMLQGIEGAEGLRLHFLHLWTLKEAYVKAIGRGIRAAPGLKSFSLVFPQLNALPDKTREILADALPPGGKRPPTQRTESAPRSNDSNTSLPLSCSPSTLENPEVYRSDGRDFQCRGDSLYNQSVPTITFETKVSQEQSLRWQFALMRHRTGHTVALCRQLVPRANDSLSDAICGESALRTSVSMMSTVPTRGSTPIKQFDLLACS